ncbi:FixH family protein [Niveibacterium umoris]|uniref:Nitrogen fixation protein FixH n=2 Tax=Niveibacterium umoris TaxID=1193620 RepID=A0A840BDD8_9RHOO|nr:FixH family protein [Niveibacterium umoris]MBB4011105.1 hypothetical protein [Niveibacterium umoris]
MKTAHPNTSQRPWYREPWPWILFGLPGIVVIASLVTLFIAIRSSDSLVVEDYYKEGLAINRTLSRQDAARAAGLSGTLTISGGGAAFALRANAGFSMPARLRLHLAHPTDARLDQLIMLERADDLYRGVMQPVGAGRWRFLIEDESRKWRISGSGVLPTTATMALAPGA